MARQWRCCQANGLGAKGEHQKNLLPMGRYGGEGKFITLPSPAPAESQARFGPPGVRGGYRGEGVPSSIFSWDLGRSALSSSCILCIAHCIEQHGYAVYHSRYAEIIQSSKQREVTVPERTETTISTLRESMVSRIVGAIPEGTVRSAYQINHHPDPVLPGREDQRSGR